MKSVILNVPYYSQSSDIKDKKWQGQACGIVSLKMVMDFFKRSNLNLENLIEEGLEEKGFVENVGWVHSGLIKIARKHNFYGWRRKFLLSPKDLEGLKGDDYSLKEIEAQNQDLLEEGIFNLAKSIANNCPVIVSVPRGFQKKGFGHLIVLTGVKNWNGGSKADGFFYNDPDNEKNIDLPRKNQFVNLKKFSDNWSKRAIFIKLKNG